MHPVNAYRLALLNQLAEPAQQMRERQSEDDRNQYAEMREHPLRRRAHLQRRALDGDNFDFRTRGQIGPLREPRRIADLHFAAAVDDRAVEHVATADELLGATVEQRLVCRRLGGRAQKPPVTPAAQDREQNECNRLTNERQTGQQ